MEKEDKGVFADSMKAALGESKTIGEVEMALSQQAIHDRTDDPNFTLFHVRDLAEIFEVSADQVAMWVVENKLPAPAIVKNGVSYWVGQALLRELKKGISDKEFFLARPTIRPYPSEKALRMLLKTAIDLTLLKKG